MDNEKYILMAQIEANKFYIQMVEMDIAQLAQSILQKRTTINQVKDYTTQLETRLTNIDENSSNQEV